MTHQDLIARRGDVRGERGGTWLDMLQGSDVDVRQGLELRTAVRFLRERALPWRRGRRRRPDMDRAAVGTATGLALPSHARLTARVQRGVRN